MIRRRLAKCVRCYWTNHQQLQPFMSDLRRTALIKPFSIAGVHYGGPFHRGAKIEKAYLC